MTPANSNCTDQSVQIFAQTGQHLCFSLQNKNERRYMLTAIFQNFSWSQLLNCWFEPHLLASPKDIFSNDTVLL